MSEVNDELMSTMSLTFVFRRPSQEEVEEYQPEPSAEIIIDSGYLTKEEYLSFLLFRDAIVSQAPYLLDVFLQNLRRARSPIHFEEPRIITP